MSAGNGGLRVVGLGSRVQDLCRIITSAGLVSGLLAYVTLLAYAYFFGYEDLGFRAMLALYNACMVNTSSALHVATKLINRVDPAQQPPDTDNPL